MLPQRKMCTAFSQTVTTENVMLVSSGYPSQLYCDIIFPSTDSEWSYLQSTMKLINMHNFQFYPVVTSPSNEQEGSNKGL